MQSRHAILAVVLALAMPAALAQGFPTQRCNTRTTDMVWLYGMTQAVQARLVQAVSQPSAEPALFEALGRPASAEASTTVLDNRSVVLHLQVFQDVAETVDRIRASALVASMGIESIGENGLACFTPPPGPRTVVTEFRNILIDRYFLSSSAQETALIDAGGAGPGWVRTGLAFSAYSHHLSDCDASRVQRVWRFYAPAPSTHFFTVDTRECGGLRNAAAGWIPEGVAFWARAPEAGACPAGLVPLHRSYNNRGAEGQPNHRFTIRLDVHRQMVANGWVDEGVALCLPAQ